MVCRGSRTVGRPPLSARAGAFDRLIRPGKAYFDRVFGPLPACSDGFEGPGTARLFSFRSATVPKVFPLCYLFRNSRHFLFIFSCL